ncbi:MAG: SCO family protein [Bacteroidota bacterium]
MSLIVSYKQHLQSGSFYPNEKIYLSFLVRNSVLLLSLSLILLGCTDQTNRLPYYNTPDFTPLFLTAEREGQDQITHQIAPFSFTNQAGKTVTEQAIESKIHVANFIFTTCGVVCPVMTNHMQQVSQTFEQDDDVVLLSYSVTPWIDDVVRLQEYAQQKNITDPNWHLLTGKKGEIYQLARQSYFAEEDLGYTKDSTEFLHTEHFILVDQNRRIRGIYNGTLALDIQQLITDIHSLKAEKL